MPAVTSARFASVAVFKSFIENMKQRQAKLPGERVSGESKDESGAAQRPGGINKYKNLRAVAQPAAEWSLYDKIYSRHLRDDV